MAYPSSGPKPVAWVQHPKDTPPSFITPIHNFRLYLRWQKQLFENGAAAFEYRPKGAQDAASKKITALEEKLVRKNEVLSELMEEHIKLKKALGDA